MPPTGTISEPNLSKDDLLVALYRRLPIATSLSEAKLASRFAHNNLEASDILGCETEILTQESSQAFETLDLAIAAFKDDLNPNSRIHEASDFYFLVCLSLTARADGYHYTFRYYGPALKFPVAPNAQIAAYCHTQSTASASLGARIANYKVEKCSEAIEATFKTKKSAVAEIQNLVAHQEHVVRVVKNSSQWQIMIIFWKFSQNIPIIGQGLSKTNVPIVRESVRRVKYAHDSLQHPVVLKTWSSKTFKYLKSALKVKQRMEKGNIENAFIKESDNSYTVNFDYYLAKAGLGFVSNEHRDFMKTRLAAPLSGSREQLDLNIGLFVNREVEPIDEGSGVGMS